MLCRPRGDSLHVVCATARAGGDSGTDGTRDRYAGEGRRGALRARRLRRRSRALVRCPAGLRRRVMAEFSTSRVLDQPSSRPVRPTARFFGTRAHRTRQRGNVSRGTSMEREAVSATSSIASRACRRLGGLRSQIPQTTRRNRRALRFGGDGEEGCRAEHRSHITRQSGARAGRGMFHVKRRAPEARTGKGPVFHVKRASSQRRRGARAWLRSGTATDAGVPKAPATPRAIRAQSCFRESAAHAAQAPFGTARVTTANRPAQHSRPRSS